MTVTKYIRSEWEKSCSCVLIRHDVDRIPSRAEALANLESKLGIKSTYYFRCNKEGRFPYKAIERIASLGHEVGYHYEDLSRCHGDREKAILSFLSNLQSFRNIAPCSTVAMHGSPLSKYDNLDLMKNVDFSTYGLVGDAVISIQGTPIVFFTDTGGYWNQAGKYNIRDKIEGAVTAPLPDSCEFEAWLRTSDISLYLSSHPERWCSGLFGFMQARGQDVFSNQLKLILRNIRCGQ